MRRLNRAVDSQQRLTAASAIFSAVERLPEFRAARTVAVFAALPDEPATDEVLARWAETRRVVLPRVEGDEMRFYACRPDALVFGAFRYSGAAGRAGVLGRRDRSGDLPGRGLHSDGRRLGRGRGTTTAILGQSAFRGIRVGVCYAHQWWTTARRTARRADGRRRQRP